MEYPELLSGIGPYECPLSKHYMKLDKIGGSDYYCSHCGAIQGSKCENNPKVLIKSIATLPPKKWIKRHSFHWLHSERASYPIICEWLGDHWYGASGKINPEEMRNRGWEWYAVALPPLMGAVPYCVDYEVYDFSYDEYLDNIIDSNFVIDKQYDFSISINVEDIYYHGD